MREEDEVSEKVQEGFVLARKIRKAELKRHEVHCVQTVKAVRDA